MFKIDNSQSGFAHFLIPVLVVVMIAGMGYVGFQAFNNTKSNEDKSANASSKKVATTPSWSTNTDVVWSATGDGSWMSFPYDVVPPACPDPISLNLPTTKIKQATSILYPGQSRTGSFEGKGGTYKAHGGIRFDKSTNDDIDVVMPFNGSVFRGTRVLVDGEIQYGFDIVNACGVMIRLGHLRELTPAFQAIADKLPPATEGDSRSEKVTPNVPFKTGDKIATAVGFRNTKNVGFDYGVYDLRKNNEASKNAAFNAAHAKDAELVFHGLCWLELASDNDHAILKALPGGDTANGKKSDYCR